MNLGWAPAPLIRSDRDRNETVQPVTIGPVIVMRRIVQVILVRFGHIELAKPVFHPGYPGLCDRHQKGKVLRCICFECSYSSVENSD